MKLASLRTRRRINNVGTGCAALTGVCGALRFVNLDDYVAGCAWIAFAVVLVTVNIELRPSKGPVS